MSRRLDGSLKEESIMKREEITIGQERELLILARRLTPDQFQTRHQLFEKITDPNFDVAVIETAMATSKQFAVWGTVKLGTHPNLDSLMDSVVAAGYHISKDAEELIQHQNFIVALQEVEVSLVCVQFRELDFSQGASVTLADICQYGQEYGLKLCESEVGLQLCRTHTDKLQDKWRWIAMKPIVSGGHSKIFSVSGGACGQWLSTDRSDVSIVWNPESEFFFRK